MRPVSVPPAGRLLLVLAAAAAAFGPFAGCATYTSRLATLRADLVYTKSIPQGALSLLTSDESIDYRGEPFELAMVPYYRALNYAFLGDREGALVEARKASLLLREYVEQDLSALGELDPDRDASGDALLKNAAFLHYISALVYEWGGETNDAFIAYRNAADAYQAAAGRLALTAPPWLAADLRRTGEKLGFRDELERLPAAFPDLFASDAAGVAGGGFTDGRLKSDGEVVLLLELGFAPHKEQRELNVPILKSDRRDDRVVWARDLRGRIRPGWTAERHEIEYWLRVAVPELVSEPPEIAGARVSVAAAGVEGRALPVEDIAGRSRATFQAREGSIYLKTFVRALAKYATQQAADRKSDVAGALANILGAVTEKADTRGWLTLPGRIAMARLQLPPGRWDVRIELTDARGAVIGTEVVPGIEVEANDRRFVSRRIY